MDVERWVLAMIAAESKLVGERVDGSGSVEQPLSSTTVDAALEAWRRLQLVTSAHEWRWSIATS